LTIYSPVQRTHRPAYVVKQGEYSQSFDVPERVDSILSAVRGKGLWPVIAPADAELEPIRAVRDAGMVEYLATAQVSRENGERVAILDIDYHHGNGTQAIFYAEPDV